jgi:hypothetical protein
MKLSSTLESFGIPINPELFAKFIGDVLSILSRRSIKPSLEKLPTHSSPLNALSRNDASARIAKHPRSEAQGTVTSAAR